MVYIVIFSVILALFYITRFYLLKKQIKRTTIQLKQLNRHITAKKIDLTYYDPDMEEMAQEINEQIELTRQANANKQRTENELKQAISNISHDIRTPMTSIMGYIQFLHSDDLTPEKRKEYTAIVQNGALRLKDLLEDFFELSIIESAEYPVKVESILLNQLVVEVLVGFYEAFTERQLEPNILIPNEEMRIISDPSMVKRVIENLVVNAIRHSSGPVTIQLEKLQSTSRLTISNPAPSLREGDLIFLFDRFYKADQQRTGKGTGLGLSIAKSLMKKMNGTLTAELTGNILFIKCEWRI